MAKNDNLKDLLTDIANAIRSKKGTTDLINPQDFSAEIASIKTGGSVPSYPNGIYIQHIDGRLFKTEEWTLIGYPNDEANGVAVYDARASFVISKTQLGVSRWYPEAVLLDCFVGSEADARLDYEGATNTEVIYVKDGSDNAATKCVDFIFPNGSTGYLPALGEWVVAYEYKQKIDEALIAIGADAIKVDTDNYAYLWSSSQMSAVNSWAMSWLNGASRYQYKTSFYSGYTDFYVRPFGELVIVL